MHSCIDRLHESFDKINVTVEFTVNRLSVRLEHRAVTWAGESQPDLDNVLFPTTRTFPPVVDPTRLQLR